MKFATKPDITHLTLGMLLHNLGKLKTQIFCRYSTNVEKNAHNLHITGVTNCQKAVRFLDHPV